MNKSILSLKKEVLDLKLYIRYLEGIVHESDIILWDDIEDMIFTKPIYTGNIDPDAYSSFMFINNIEE